MVLIQGTHLLAYSHSDRHPQTPPPHPLTHSYFPTKTCPAEGCGGGCSAFPSYSSCPAVSGLGWRRAQAQAFNKENSCLVVIWDSWTLPGTTFCCIGLELQGHQDPALEGLNTGNVWLCVCPCVLVWYCNNSVLNNSVILFWRGLKFCISWQEMTKEDVESGCGGQASTS